MDEELKIKAEIFDIIRQQAEYITMANDIQKIKIQKLHELDAIENGNEEDLIIAKAKLFDIMTQQEQYIQEANNLDQVKLKKLQLLKDIKKEKN